MNILLEIIAAILGGLLIMALLYIQPGMDLTLIEELRR